MTKRLKNYILQLPLLGLASVMSGGFFAYILFNAEAFWSIFYAPIRIFFIILSYILINHIAPGGNVNFHFGDYTLNEDEKKLDRLIIKYRNKLSVAMMAVLLSAFDLFFSLIHHNPTIKVDIGNIFGLLIGTFLAAGPMLVGVKYFSAWWNIRRNWEKEFGEK